MIESQKRDLVGLLEFKLVCRPPCRHSEQVMVRKDDVIEWLKTLEGLKKQLQLLVNK